MQKYYLKAISFLFLAVQVTPIDPPLIGSEGPLLSFLLNPILILIEQAYDKTYSESNHFDGVILVKFPLYPQPR